MSTRTPTAADYAGTSERGKAAYAARIANLRRFDPEVDETDDLDPVGVVLADFDRELQAIEQADAKAQAELRAAGWPVPDDDRSH